MTAAEAIVFAALMIGLVSILGVIADIYKRRLALKERTLELAAKDRADQATHFAAQAQRLEQRVRVLERIATDTKGNAAADLAY
jgi:hypothetical protein